MNIKANVKYDLKRVSKLPIISAIMPVYNSERFVGETIDSILNQSFTDFEFIIVNDGSTDKTKKIIESYNDDRIKLYNLEINRGVGYASNFAVEKAQGKYIARIDSDDIYHKDKFLLQKEFLDKNPEIDLVKSLFDYFGDGKLRDINRLNGLASVAENYTNKIINSNEIAEKLLWASPISNNTTMIRSQVLKKFGYKDMRCGEDYHLFYNMSKKGHKMGTVSQYLTKMRVSNNSITATRKFECYESFYTIKKDIMDPICISKNIYLWGAGSFGLLVYEILTKYGHKIEGFIDSDKSKQGQSISGLTVYDPSILTSCENIGVIVTSQPGRVGIVKELEGKGYSHLKDFVVY
ncbi:MAG: glycosyltransferase [Tissierellaceae bacterium]